MQKNQVKTTAFQNLPQETGTEVLQIPSIFVLQRQSPLQDFPCLLSGYKIEHIFLPLVRTA